jgi:hypothetical protein
MQQNLPKFIKICPKTISLGIFEIPPKTKTLLLIPKKVASRRGTRACVCGLDFQYNNFLYAFLIVKRHGNFIISAYALVEFLFFSMFSIPCRYEIL